MKDVQKIMTKTQALTDIKILFGLYNKMNKFDEYEYPFIYNFISAGLNFLFIKKNRKGLYEVCGKLPFHVDWQVNQTDNYVDVFVSKKTLKEAKDCYYILVEKLIHRKY